jgi:TonB family protein
MKTNVLLLISALLAVPAFAADMPAASSSKHLKVIQTESMRYPLEMRMNGVRTGTVRAILQVDADGRLSDHLIIAYTKKPFADEVVRTITKWKFEPEVINGTPVASVVELTFDFRVDGIMLVQKLITEVVRSDPGDDRFEYQVRSMKYLDKIPTPVNVVNPGYPKEYSDQGIVGKVVVDFYIDENGAVRMPAALVGSNPLLAGLAVNAVEKWQFTPPTYRGRPVMVHVQQTFNFQ